MDVNATKEKKLTNIRTHSHDEALRLTPPPPMTLESAIEFIAADELVEVTPQVDPAAQADRSRSTTVAARRGREDGPPCATPEAEARNRRTGPGAPVVQSGRDDHLPRSRRDAPRCGREVLERDAARPDRGTAATRRRRTARAAGRAGPSTRRTSGRARRSVRSPRDRLHERRHGGHQPRPQGCRVGGQGVRAPHRDHGRGAPGRAGRLRHLEKFGFEVTVLPVDRYGRVDPDELDGALTERTMPRVAAAGQQRGGHHPAARRAGARVRAVAARSSTSMRCRPRRRMASTSGDWTWTCCPWPATSSRAPRAPERCGCAVARAILPQVHGGSQERYRRAGTENVAGAVGMAAVGLRAGRRRASPRGGPSARPAPRPPPRRARHEPASSSPATPSSGCPARCPSSCAASDGDALVMALDLEGLACSTGSACTTGSTDPRTC